MTDTASGRSVWTTPALTVLSVSFDTAAGGGSGGDGTGPTKIG